MFFNLFLVILFAGSVGVLWYRISEKIPELIAIPDEVIVARLHEDSARVRIFILHARTFWREPRYRESFWHFCEKICYRAHILLLRTDNGLMAVAKKVRAYGDQASADILAGTPADQREGKTMETAYTSDISVSIASPRVSFASSLALSPHIAPADSHPYIAPSPHLHPRVGARVQEVRKRRVKTATGAESRKS